MSWANRYLNTYTKSTFLWPGFSAQTGKVFPYSKSFQLGFCSREPKLYWLTLPAALLDYRLITLFSAPCPLGKWRNTTVRKNCFPHLQVKKEFQNSKWKYAWVKVHVFLVAGNWTGIETGAFLPDWSQRSIDKRLRNHIEQDLSREDHRL